MNIINNSKNAIANLNNASSKMNLAIYLLTAISVISYIVVVNYTNTMGYEIAEMQLSINGLEKEYRDLQNVATGLQSIDRIEQISNQQLNMVNVGKIDYVALDYNKVVALNK